MVDIADALGDVGASIEAATVHLVGPSTGGIAIMRCL